MSRHNPRLRTNNQFPKLNTDQKAAQVASAPPGPLSDVETKLMEIRQKVERNRARWSRHGYEWFSRRSQRRHEEGKLQEDRSKAVIAKAISEATDAVEKASAEAQSYLAEVREGSDGTLPS